MEYLGIDVHSKYSEVCGLSDDGTVTVRRRVSTTETSLRRLHYLAGTSLARLCPATKTGGKQRNGGSRKTRRAEATTVLLEGRLDATPMQFVNL